jgi:uncharacterized phage-like protein YoqJ
MKLAVVGSRHFFNYNLLKETLDKIKNVDLIVSGGNRTYDHYNRRYMGADYLAEVYATVKNIPLLIYPATWYVKGQFDRSAGFKRNTLIVKNSDEVLAFWDGETRGTANTIEQARKAKKKVTVVNFRSTHE